MPVGAVGQQTGLGLTKEAIPVLRHKIIKPVANRSRKHSCQSRNPPRPAQNIGEKQQGVRLCQQFFVGLSVIAHAVDSVEICMINTVTSQQIRREAALQWSETEPVVAISFEEKLNGAIAETADTVVKNNRAGYRFKHDSTSNLAG
jgi:hypothetical protein